jgi:peptidyl-prolyl cis-trans isomerase B (cyclophilin B)
MAGAILLLTGCQPKSAPPTSSPPPAGATSLPMAATAAKPPSAPIVTMVTDKGTILIKLFPEDAPITVANFEKLVKKGFYNGLTFWRVDNLEADGQGHIIQGGDPQGNGQGGPGYMIKGEFPENGVQNPLKHVAGAVAMARTNQPDSAGSQFYIVVTPTPSLDGKYAVFGQVIKGLDVANKIQVGDKMTKVTLKE